jgi:hypothetical protein
MHYSTNNWLRGTKHDGFAIALAWPETLCKQAGAWYDYLLYYTGINRKGYYKVGHAAVVLVDDETQSCRYFDFGRYHAPHGYGRVRSAKTDHDLNMKIKASISNEKREINNLNEILSGLHTNSSTHGSGTIYGVATRIDFNKALSYTKQLQDKEFNPYGPFLSNGTNCSRFVNSVIRAGKPALVQRIKLQYPLTFSPTPMWNLRAIGGTISSIGRSYRKVEDLLIKQEPELIAVV